MVILQTWDRFLHLYFVWNVKTDDMQQEGMNVYYLDDDSEMRKVLISEVPIDGWV